MDNKSFLKYATGYIALSLFVATLVGSIYVFFHTIDETNRAAEGSYVDTDWIIGKTQAEVEERFGNAERIFLGVDSGDFCNYYIVEYNNGYASKVTHTPKGGDAND